MLINHTDSMKLFFVRRSCFVRLNLVTMVTRHERRQDEHNGKHKCTQCKMHLKELYYLPDTAVLLVMYGKCNINKERRQ